MYTALHNRPIWITLSWFWYLVIVIISLITIPKSIDVSIPYLDKIEHAISYFLLMFLFSQCYRENKSRIIYALLFICTGIVLEIFQSYIITRQFEYADMLANSIGVISGLLMSDSFLQKIVIYVDNKLNDFKQ